MKGESCSPRAGDSLGDLGALPRLCASPPPHGFGSYVKPAVTIVYLWDGSAALHADLHATQVALAAGSIDLADLHSQVRIDNELLQTLFPAMQAGTSGVPGNVTVEVGDMSFHLHKCEVDGARALAGGERPDRDINQAQLYSQQAPHALAGFSSQGVREEE